MNLTDIQIREDPSFIEFPATTCALAVTKFLRLNRLNPGPWNNSQHLLSAGKDLKNAEEYDLFLEWLGNPYSVKNTGVLPEEPAFDIEQLNIGTAQHSTTTKVDGNTLVIRVVNDEWGKETETEPEPEEKVMD